jgi:dTDP-glucose 4,6-dehydratase
MKLLITGGAGFIGSAFIRMWHREHPDDHIVNLDALTYAANLNALEEVSKSDNYTFIEGDITDPATVEKAMQDVDKVIHFAADVVGTQVLLDAARAAGVSHFHHISTDEVFGDLSLEGDEKFSEETPYHPHSPYSASKAASDHLVRAYYRTYTLPVTVSNCTNNYGAWQHPEKLIPTMIGKALRDEPLPVYGKGANIRDWIHVDDHCRGVALVLEKGTIGETYCFGGNAERTNMQVVKEILKSMKKDENLISFVEDRAGHDLRYAVDSRKAEKELGWDRTYSFETGLAQTIEWYMQHQEIFS